MLISRRDFLKILGASGIAMAGLHSMVTISPEIRKQLLEGPRVETWRKTTCTLCPGGCGLNVRMIDNIPVRLKGNPQSPVNKGKICPLGESGLQWHYHPGRLCRPLRNVGQKGDARWEEIPWEDALAIVSDNLMQVQRNDSQRFGYLIRYENTLTGSFAAYFTERMGSRHFYTDREITSDTFTQGDSGAVCDLYKADLILTFGINLLEDPYSPVYFNQLVGHKKAQQLKKNSQIYHFAPRKSLAGQNANDWIAVSPEFYGLIVLGIMNVLLNGSQKDVLWDAKELGELRQFFKFIKSYCSPEIISHKSQVPVEVILDIAASINAARSPVALIQYPDGSRWSYFNRIAIQSLNYLMGNQTMWKAPVTPLFPFTGDTKLIPALYGAILPQLSKNNSFELFFLDRTDPLFQFPNPEEWKHFLNQIPTVVQFASLLNESSPYADFILPVPSPYEIWDYCFMPDCIPETGAGIMQPLISPLPGTKSTGDILLELDKQISGSLFGEMDDWKAVNDDFTHRLYLRKDGYPFFELISSDYVREMKKRGFGIYSYTNFEEFEAIIKDKGGWRYTGNFKNLSLKELRHDLSKKLAQKSRPPESGKIWQPVKLWLETPVAADDKFQLITFRSIFNMHPDSDKMMLMNELTGLYSRHFWDTWLEINPDDAAELQVKDKDMVIIKSDTDEVSIPVLISQDIQRGFAALSLAAGRKYPEYDTEFGTNGMSLLTIGRDQYTDLPFTSGVRIAIVKAEVKN